MAIKIWRNGGRKYYVLRNGSTNHFVKHNKIIRDNNISRSQCMTTDEYENPNYLDLMWRVEESLHVC